MGIRVQEAVSAVAPCLAPVERAPAAQLLPQLFADEQAPVEVEPVYQHATHHDDTVHSVCHATCRRTHINTATATARAAITLEPVAVGQELHPPDRKDHESEKDEGHCKADVDGAVDARAQVDAAQVEEGRRDVDHEDPRGVRDHAQPAQH
eukprot:6171891-Pleurochrysis_carterae.AAC.2